MFKFEEAAAKQTNGKKKSRDRGGHDGAKLPFDSSSPVLRVWCVVCSRVSKPTCCINLDACLRQAQGRRLLNVGGRTVGIVGQTRAAVPICAVRACGTGTIFQTRSCSGCLGSCSGPTEQYISGNAGPPVAWTVWSDSDLCSTACGVGTLPQSRTCDGCVSTCSGSPTQSISCSRGPIKAWTAWTNTSFCSIKVRRRQAESGANVRRLS